jgi:hypothetical protein
MMEMMSDRCERHGIVIAPYIFSDDGPIFYFIVWS